MPAPNNASAIAVERALEVGERDALADDQALDLVEHRRVREVEIVAAIDRTDRDQAHRRRIVLHVPDLHRARVRAQQGQRSRRLERDGFSRRWSRLNRRLQVQRVLHVARGMIRRHVERFEVVVVVLDLGAFEHLVAEAREDLDHFIANQAERMAMAELRHAAGQRDVDGVGGPARRGERRLALGERGFDFLLELVGALAERFLLLGRRGLERLHEGGGPAVVAADPARAQRLQLRVRTHLGQLGAEQFPRAIWTDGWVDGAS